MLKGFRDFLMRGNVIDLAVGVIIGAAFGKIVTSAIADLIMPPVGMAIGGVDFVNLFISLNGIAYASLEEAQKAGAPTINYGRFINTILEFIIVAFVVFLIARALVPKALPTKFCQFCGEEILESATRCRYCTSQLTTVGARTA
jgi:large conductance mechanosensitive channel